MNETPDPTGKDINGVPIAVGFVAAVLAAFGFVGWRCYAYQEVNWEWNALWAAEAKFKDHPYTQLDFMEFKGWHVVGVRGLSGERIWVLLDGKYDSLYKQRPSEGQYDLTNEDYMKIVKSAPVSLTVMQCLRSHVVERPRGS